MPRFKAHSGDLYFEQHGARANPPVLLIAGVGQQLIHWPASFIDGLVNAGYRLVLFDNRDSGLSDGADDPPPSLEALFAAKDGAAITPAYTLADLAQDAVDLLDHLGQAGAHVVGFSMGAMIGQHIAAHQPERAFSLTCISASAHLPDASEDVLAALLGGATSEGEDAIITGDIKGAQVLGGAHYDSEIHGQARFARAAYERAHRPDGFIRQLAAIVHDGDRTHMLSTVRTPTLVIHGADDPLFGHDGGKTIASVVPGARLEVVEQVGHDLPEPVIGHYVELIAAHLGAVDITR